MALMLKVGAIVLGVLIVLGLAWVFWTYLIPWPYSAEATSVLVTGLLAVAAAVWALYSQRAIPRRQCTLEHLAQLEADADAVAYRRIFREQAEKGTLTGLAAVEKQQTPEFRAVISRLNELELIAIGIQRGVIDFELYKRWFKSGALRAWRDAEPFIRDFRNRHNNQILYHEFFIMSEWFRKDEKPVRSRFWGIWF
jgi:hypothetical protein